MMVKHQRPPIDWASVMVWGSIVVVTTVFWTSCIAWLARRFR